MGDNIILQFALFHNIDLDYAIKLINHRNCICKCGRFKQIKLWGKSGKYRMYTTCGKTECHWSYGRKRPEHSATMKQLAINGSNEYINTLMKKGEKFNKQVNTASFFRKKLATQGHNIDDSMTDNDILILNSTSESQKTKTLSHKIKTTISRYNTWEDEYKQLCLLVTGHRAISKELFDLISTKEAIYICKRIHGINTIRNWGRTKSNRVGWFIRETITNLQFNNQGKTSITTRSGLEARYIQLFENNGWIWSYESIILESINNDCFHVPDFLVTINGITYMLEVKGSFYRQHIEEYITNKVGAAIKYCYEHNMVYILTRTVNPKNNLNFLSNAMINTTKGNLTNDNN